MPGISGLELLEQVERDDPDTAVIILTAFGCVEGAVKAMRQGAAHYLLKPLSNPDELRLAVRRVLEERRLADEAATLRQATEAAFPFGEIIAATPRCGRPGTGPLGGAHGRDSTHHRRDRDGKGAIARAIITGVPGRTGPSSRSTAPRWPRPCWRASCSATRKGPSPGPWPSGAAASSWLTEEPSSWTRSGR